MSDILLPTAVAWSGGQLRLLDQTRLPDTEIYLACPDAESVYLAIRRLAVRGAPAIGIAAAFGMVVGLESATNLAGELQRRADLLTSARPTAVNLKWAVDRMLRVAEATPTGDVIAALIREAEMIREEDARACQLIGEAGLPLVRERPALLTHCNAGSLAVSAYGTALAPVYRAHAEGIAVHVYVDETRPLLQGARLTAFELQKSGVPMTLVTDSMAAHLMSRGQIQAVIVGADRVAANGDVANKIGTLGLAILCQYFELPFYVACPTSTIDLGTATGDDIVIEARDPAEVLGFAGVRVAPLGTPVINPAFDVTPAALVSAIVTERGVVDARALGTLFD